MSQTFDKYHKNFLGKISRSAHVIRLVEAGVPLVEARLMVYPRKSKIGHRKKEEK